MDAIVHITDEYIAVQSGGDGRLAKRAIGGMKPSGIPRNEAADVLADIFKSLKLISPTVAFILPFASLRTRRLRVDIPVRGVVRGSHLAMAREEMARSIYDPSRVRVYFHPASFSIDGKGGTGDPVGQSAERLTIENLAICTTLATLTSYERLIQSAGGILSDVVIPYTSLAAAVLKNSVSGTILHMGYSELALCDIRNHFIRGAASAQIGFRHLIKDIMYADGCDEVEASAAIRSLLKKKPTPSSSTIEIALDARLAELADWIESTMRRNNMQGPVIVNGAFTEVTRLSEIVSGTTFLSSTLDAKGALAPLSGARSVLDGTYGVHSPAEWSARSPRLSGSYIVQWLRTHF